MSTDVNPEITNIDYLSAADKFWLGEQLSISRLSRGLDIPSVARLLNLSQTQVLAIESGSQGPFLQIAHFVQGVRNYAQSMNTPQAIEVLNWLERAEELSQSAQAVSSQVLRIDKMLRTRLANDVMAPASGSRFNRQGKMVSSIALIVLGFVITLPLMWGINDDDFGVADHKVALTQAAIFVQLSSDSVIEEAVTHPQQIEIEPSRAGDKLVNVKFEKKPSTLLGLNFTAPCWVQVTTNDGQVTDRLYEVSEELLIDLEQTASLVIGNVNGVKAVTERGKPVDFKSLVASGNVARINGQDLVALAKY